VAYTANFSNNQGFAVLAADTRLKSPVLAITESGSLSSSTLQNAVTKAATEKITEITGGTLGSQNDPLIYIPPTPDYITAEMLAKMMMDIVMPKPIYDEDGNLIGWDTNIPGKMEEFYYPAIPLNSDGSQMYPMNVSIGSPSSSYKHVVAPMLKTHWHQYAPFYNNCYTIGGSQALTGCVAIALAQMIAANEHPYWPSTVAKDKSVTSSWADLKSYDSDPLSWYQLSTTPEYRARVESDMAKVIRAIGDGVLTIYGSSGSDAVASSAAAYMDVMKEYEALWVDYNWTDIDNMLRNRLPVFISGYRNILSGGHAWVIDGMIQYTTTVLTQKWGLEYVKGKGYKRVKIGEPFHVTEEYGDCLLHCNWGGGGTSDGYYYSKAFNASAGPVRKEAGLDTVTYTDGSDYNDNLTLIRYERK
jgi:hypothetical protein